MKHGERVEVYVSGIRTGIPTKRGSVQPQRTMGLLHTFGPCRGATRVVDGGGLVFVRFPRHRVYAGDEQLAVCVVANGVLKLALDRCQVFFDLGIDE